MLTLQVFILVLSLVALYYGAEFVLESAEKVGRSLGFSPLVIGLVIVGFGTSLPEFFVSHLASLRGEYPIALGNIVGSNVANLFLILGLTAVITPLSFSGHSLRDQLIVHLILTLAVGVLFLFNELYLIGAGVLLLFFVVYLSLTYRDMKNDREVFVKSDEVPEKLVLKDFIVLNIGFVLLYAGGEMLVSSGSKIGLALGVSSFVISAIFVAFGTSFPELVTALMACIRKKDLNLITGNIIGSNVFNISLILGTLGLHRLPITQTYSLEMSVLLVAGFFLLLLCVFRRNMGKLAGAGFLASYGAMIFYWANLGS